jgi:hypothetical protein
LFDEVEYLVNRRIAFAAILCSLHTNRRSLEGAVSVD